MEYRQYTNKVEDVLPRLADNTFDGCLCDPPYGLVANKRGGSGEASLNLNNPASRSRITTGGGFMGQAWDAKVPGVEIWREVLRVLKPGAILLAFGGTRTFHRLTCAIEDAGFEIRDCLMWLYGSGFPKSHDISKGIDKLQGNDRPVIGTINNFARDGSNRNSGKHVTKSQRPYQGDNMMTGGSAWDVLVTSPGGQDSAIWQGYGTAIKPSWEPIVQARKPLTIVPDRAVLQEITNLLGGLLCLSFDVKSASGNFLSSLPELPEDMCASVAQHVGILHGLEYGASLEEMGMCSSPETGSMCLNIASSWKNILDEVLDPANTFTTKTETALITVWKILKCLISEIMPEGIIKELYRPVGPVPSAPTAKLNSADVKTSQSDTLNATARVLATWRQNVSGMSVKRAAQSSQQIIRSVFTALQSVIESIEKEKANNKSSYAPAWEPIICAMKPLEPGLTYAKNALNHGVAGLNIDGCRIIRGSDDISGWSKSGSSESENKSMTGKNYYRDAEPDNSSGRWPANLVLDEESAVMLDEQSDFTISGTQTKENPRAGSIWKTSNGSAPEGPQYGDSGGASRFFYCAKVSTSERNLGGTDCKHPTLKPLKLTEYLARLILPPARSKSDSLRSILVPFSGAGSEIIGAHRAGWDSVTGIEMSDEYVSWSRQRIYGA